MEIISQSKVSSRSGPLIAVIKIQISSTKTDRIFLHQNDDDMYLAQQFVNKHGLKQSLVQHIYRKIQISRASLMQQKLKDIQIQNLNDNNNNINNNSNSKEKIQQQQMLFTNTLHSLNKNQNNHNMNINLNNNNNKKKHLNINQNINPNINRHQTAQQKTKQLIKIQHQNVSPSYRNYHYHPQEFQYTDMDIDMSSNKKSSYDYSPASAFILISPNQNKNKSDHFNSNFQNNNNRNIRNVNQFYPTGDSIANNNSNNIPSSTTSTSGQNILHYNHNILGKKSSYHNTNSNNSNYSNSNNYTNKIHQYQIVQQQQHQQNPNMNTNINSNKKQNTNTNTNTNYMKYQYGVLHYHSGYPDHNINENKYYNKGLLQSKSSNTINSNTLFDLSKTNRTNQNQNQNLSLKQQFKINNFNHQNKSNNNQITKYQKDKRSYSQRVFQKKSQNSYQQNHQIKNKNQSYINFKNLKQNHAPGKITNNNGLLNGASKRANQNNKEKTMALRQLNPYEVQSNSDYTFQDNQNQNLNQNNNNNNKNNEEEEQFQKNLNQTKKIITESNKKILNRNHSKQRLKNNENDNYSQRHNFNYQHNSFHKNQNQNKPSRVKILTKQDINSLRSSSLQRSMSKTEISRINKDVTSRLYNQSQIKKNYLNKIRQKAKVQKDDKQILECTHSPSLNPISSVLANQRNKLSNQPIHERLIESGRKAEIKRQNSKNKLVSKELNGCSFHPQLNPLSQRLAKGRSVTVLSRPKINITQSINQNVHSNHLLKQKCKDDIMYKPKINKVSQQIVKTKGNFDQRLKAFLEKKNMNLSQKTKLKMKQEKIDQQSGQPLFQPKLYQNNPQLQKNSNSTNSHNKSRDQTQDICQYLYNLSKIPKQVPFQDHNIKINQNSQNLVQRMYDKRLNWLFSQLDDDHDGIISPQKITINTLSNQLFDIILPVLQQMEQMNIQLSLNDFKVAIQYLHPSLNALQKSVLYDYKKKK